MILENGSKILNNWRKLMIKISIYTGILILLIIVSCNKNPQENSLELLPTNTPSSAHKPYFKINNCRFDLEIAKTVEERSIGLMNRNKLSKTSAMIFIFEKEEYLNFWMKDTFIALDILFLSSEFEILDIQSMQPQKINSKKLLPIYTSTKPAKYAIELNTGLLKKCQIEINEIISITSLE
jgi:uncharacterized membrane protein (UPF0127 family)